MVAAAGPAKARSVNGLGWQTAIRGLFDPQRIFGAVANRGGGADGSAAPAGSQLRPLIGSPEQFKCLMDYHRAAASADDSIKLRLAVDDIDILSLLPKLTIPTMVFHCRRDHLVPFEQGRLLAASIPNAKFIPLDSENHILLSHEPAFSRWIADTETFYVTADQISQTTFLFR